MSHTVKTTSANTTDPTVNDPRVAEVAGFAKLGPAETLGHIREDAQADGNTVEQELTKDFSIVEMIEELGQDSDEADNDL